MGRKKLTDEEKRKPAFYIQCTDDEKAEIERAVELLEEDGLRPGTWIREKALAAARRIIKKADDDA